MISISQLGSPAAGLVRPTESLSTTAPPRPGSPAAPAGPFGQLLGGLLARAGAEEVRANQVVQDFALGKTENVHNVLLAVTKADLAFRMMLEVRNRLTDALQEILRMQV